MAGTTSHTPTETYLGMRTSVHAYFYGLITLLRASRLFFLRSSRSQPAMLRAIRRIWSATQGVYPERDSVAASSKHDLHLHPHAADAAVGEIAIQELSGSRARPAHW